MALDLLIMMAGQLQYSLVLIDKNRSVPAISIIIIFDPSLMDLLSATSPQTYEPPPIFRQDRVMIKVCYFR